MSFLRDLIELITIPPGDMVYHLVTLFAIQLVLAIAFGHWNRNRRSPNAIRLLVVGAALVLARALLMLIAVLDRIGVLSPNVILPPLERFLDLAALLLIVWAFLPVMERSPRTSVALVIISLLIAASIYVAFAVTWPRIEIQSIPYNGHWQETVWEFLSIAVTVLAIAASVIWREGDWSLATFLFTLWLVGHVLQFFVPFPIDSHTAGWVRLGNLAALPLVAGLAYRRVLNTSLAPVARVSAGREIIGVLGVTQRIESAQNIEAALKSAAPSIAHALGADVIAIGLPMPGLAKKLRIAALYPSTGAMLAKQEPTLLVSRHPLLATAIKTGSLQRASAPGKDPSIVSLYNRLGFEQPGPLLALPLVDEGALLGVILAGNSASQRDWTIRSEQIFQAVGAAITRAWANAFRREPTDRDVTSRESLDEINRLAQQAADLAQKAADLETSLEQQTQRAEELDTKLRLKEQQGSSEDIAAADAAFWQDEMQNLLQSRLATQTEISEWKGKAEQLARAEGSLQNQLLQAQSQLDTAQNQLKAATTREQSTQRSSSPYGTMVSNEQGNIIIVNQGVRQLLGNLRSPLEGTSIQTLFTEPAWVEATNRLLHEETHDDVTVILDLGKQVVRAELTRIPSITGGIGTLAVMFYPEETVTFQNDAMISLIHELRTPMTSITGYTELLLGESVGILGATQRQLLQRIDANIERMGGQLEDLVKVTSVDANQVSLSPEPVDLINVIEDAIMSLSAQFSKHSVGVQMDMPSELPPIHADRDSLYQIVLHLLSNACRCSRPDSEVIIQARLEEYDTQIDNTPDYLFMSVTDTGGGVAPEDQRRVFQRLYRADNPTIKGMGDTGVGLSIAKALVETQGGRIWAESEMEIGTTFSFILPLSSHKDGGLSAGSFSAIRAEVEREQ